MNILVTGAGGNLGTAIRKLAMPRHQIISLDRSSKERLHQAFSESIDIVIHSAYDLRTSFRSHPTAAVESNLRLTAELLEASRSAQVKKFIYISSSAVYGLEPHPAEHHPCQPVNSYGMLKLVNERMVQEFCESHGLEYQIFRIFNIFGGNDRVSVICKLLDAMKSQKPFRLANEGFSSRDFIHVDDAAATILKIMEADSLHNIFNVGTGIATKLSDLVAIALRHKPDILLEQTQCKETPSICADTSLMRRFVSIDFRHIVPFFENAVVQSLSV